MKFILNKQTIQEDALPANLTILRYLREYKKLVGTKEGCGSGDCGACTVLIGNYLNGEVEYQSVNACIALMGSVSGKHLVTIEHLENDGHLHPSQNAMVKLHGSQCGFCTPGFVMSLAALYERYKSNEGNPIHREHVQEAISGNLCRCTGYRPIVDAGIEMCKQTELSFSNNIQEQFHELSTDVKNPETNPTNYWMPENIAQLKSLMKKHPGAKLIAGGTDLGLEITQLYKTMDAIIDLSQVHELTTIVDDGITLSIGAATSYIKIEQHLKNEFPALRKILKRVGSTQIRNKGTIGGNLANASPVADIPPILLSVNAEIDIESCEGECRRIKVDDFYTGYKQTILKKGEFISLIHIPLNNIRDFHRFYKISKRIEDDISSVMIAARFVTKGNIIENATIAFGGVAATPVRIKALEQCLQGGDIYDQNTLSKAKQILQKSIEPLSDVRASAQYRVEICCNLIEKIWWQLRGEQLPDLSDSSVGIHA